MARLMPQISLRPLVFFKSLAAWFFNLESFNVQCGLFNTITCNYLNVVFFLLSLWCILKFCFFHAISFFLITFLTSFTLHKILIKFVYTSMTFIWTPCQQFCMVAKMSVNDNRLQNFVRISSTQMITFNQGTEPYVTAWFKPFQC